MKVKIIMGAVLDLDTLDTETIEKLKSNNIENWELKYLLDCVSFEKREFSSILIDENEDCND